MDEATNLSENANREPEPEGPREPEAAGARPSANPYATGGGGVTLERRVGVAYLALMLTREGAQELGHGRTIESVAFQQSHRTPIDDLVVRAGHRDEDWSLELAIAVRRSPKIVQSDEDMRRLVVAFLRSLADPPADRREHELAMVVAGSRPQAKQLAELAVMARRQSNAQAFFVPLRSEGTYNRALRDRLGQMSGLVRQGLATLGEGEPTGAELEARVWELLRRLHVLTPELEEPGLSDWDAVRNRLIPFSRTHDLDGGERLRDRLEALAADYGPAAATVDLGLLRRALHPLLDSGALRSVGWQAIGALEAQARDVVRDEIGRGGSESTFHLDRSAEVEALIAARSASPALVVHGESGVGKSALAFAAVDGELAARPDELEVVVINLRHLPETLAELVGALGSPLEDLLAELSAPERLLVVDGADAVLEGRRDIFTHLVAAAGRGGMAVLVIAADEGWELVRDIVSVQLVAEVGGHSVPGLTDEQIDEAVAALPELERLAANERSRELLRRVIVIDLLVRSKLPDLPLSDVEAMEAIWTGLVRDAEQADRGHPFARELVLLTLAEQALNNRSAIEVARTLDVEALEGLRRDGLLRSAGDRSWQVLPEFAHDEIRRYAVARFLFADGTPVAALRAAGAPRWAFSAVRLGCQALLSTPDEPGNPFHGRLGRVQAEFDALATTEGARWGDLPSEALLTLGDPSPLLQDAWPGLLADNGVGVARILRLIGQRFRSETLLIDPVIAEPVVAQLLEAPTPWRQSDKSAETLREWLIALVVRRREAGHPLRVRLRELLLAYCDAGERREQEQRERAALEIANRSPEEEARAQEKIRATVISGMAGRRRPRSDVPAESSEEIVLQLIALLGPDLNDETVGLLRRVARDASWRLAPAVDEAFSGQAIAGYGQGLLAELTEAYYIDPDQPGFGFFEDGIRRHQGGGFGPLHAFYRGPFLALFQSDFPGGVRVLNHMLDHAAEYRVRELRSLVADPGASEATGESEAVFGLALALDGRPRVYAGDADVWLWYRGTSVGPYACMSALEALERVCDQFLAAGVPLGPLAERLLQGCNNLAMPALVVGLLVRHLEHTERLLDPYLVDPRLWNLEFNRVVSEMSGLGGRSDGLANPERRGWSFREVATWLVVHADAERSVELKAIGEELVARAERLEATAADADAGEATGERVSYTTTVRNWASALNRDNYEIHAKGDAIFVQSTPPPDVLEALEPTTADLARGNEATRLLVRYLLGPRSKPGETAPPTKDELRVDLKTARGLLDDPPGGRSTGEWDVPLAVAAAALEAHLLRGIVLPNDDLEFAAAAVLSVPERSAEPGDTAALVAYFEQAYDRTAARARPLLLLPDGPSLVKMRGRRAAKRVMEACLRSARADPNEVRLHLARGLDPVWRTPCGAGRCHHERALELAVETMRDCVFGHWDDVIQRQRAELIDGPVDDRLAKVDGRAVFVMRLDAAIRALGVAASGEDCQRERARELLLVLLDAQRRGLLVRDDLDHRGTHALIAARALLTLASTGDEAPFWAHLEGLAENSQLLATFLTASAAAAEESAPAAEVARHLWPSVIERVLGFERSGLSLSGRGHGGSARAALMPTPTSEVAYFYRELAGAPIVWPDVLAWRSAIESWLPGAAGDPDCVDSLVGLLRTLPPATQATVGLPWMSEIILPGPETIADRTFLLARWLIDLQQAAAETAMLGVWQQIVDALVVAGDSRLGPYSN